jgi:DNA-directed RNA polymerase subunit M/transcription elongation factor TFIIS
MSNLLIQFQDIFNKLKFTIPLDIYDNKLYNKNRRAILLLIAGILEKNKKFKLKHKQIQSSIIINIELSCYNQTITKADELLIYQSWDNDKFTYLYYLNCNKITKNLDIESEVNSSYLINKILQNSININNIASMTSEELCPNKSQNIKDTINKRNNQEIKPKTSTLYTCKNCKRKEVSIHQIQIKALDEGTNLSLTCQFCNYRWIVGG